MASILVHRIAQAIRYLQLWCCMKLGAVAEARVIALALGVAVAGLASVACTHQDSYALMCETGLSLSDALDDIERSHDLYSSSIDEEARHAATKAMDSATDAGRLLQRVTPSLQPDETWKALDVAQHRTLDLARVLSAGEGTIAFDAEVSAIENELSVASRVLPAECFQRSSGGPEVSAS